MIAEANEFNVRYCRYYFSCHDMEYFIEIIIDMLLDFLLMSNNCDCWGILILRNSPKSYCGTNIFINSLGYLRPLNYTVELKKTHNINLFLRGSNNIIPYCLKCNLSLIYILHFKLIIRFLASLRH